MTPGQLHANGSFTGRHRLLPASREAALYEDILNRRASRYTIISWTFGRGSVIWRIWPAVLLHTIFAAAVVSVSLKTNVKLDIPSVMLTVLGVVIGFVLAYRVGSGHDRYWMGRTCWSDLIRNSRTMSRLIWFHVPPRLTPKTAEEIAKGKGDRSKTELDKVMAEKRLAMDLILGFSVAVKHHLRGELGIYFEDLYHLVRPLHDHDRPPRKPRRSLSPQPVDFLCPQDGLHNTTDYLLQPNTQAAQSTPVTPAITSSLTVLQDPVIPPINAYGTFNNHVEIVSSHPNLSLRSGRSHSAASSRSSRSIQRRPLLPSALPVAENILSGISSDLIPFSSFFNAIRLAFWRNVVGGRPLEVLPPSLIMVEDQSDDENDVDQYNRPPEKRILRHKKHRPRVAGDGQNLPLQILRCLSEWCSVLEDRGTVPGTSMGALLGCIASFEDNLSAMERILTTPLPFVYSVHIRHTVWLYLFFLPFQLVNQFGWYTIPGVLIAAFIYLGFLAAGEEIEQPFGYDDNDLDLDLFCHEIIHADIERLKRIPGLNACLIPHEESGFRTLGNTIETADEDHISL